MSDRRRDEDGEGETEQPRLEGSSVNQLKRSSLGSAP